MRLVFMGTPEAAVPTLRRCLADGHEIAAVWTQPDRPAGRGLHLIESPVKKLAVLHNLVIVQPQKIKTQEALDLFKSRGADAAIVVAYGRILPPSFLQAMPRGCINVHFSLLPAYRGAAPVNWSIVNGESQTGVSTMLMDEGLDTGPILLQRAHEIGPHETAPELMSKLAEMGSELLSETLRRLNEIQPSTQNDADATFAPVLHRSEGLIDWRLDAVEIERRVRGFQPWPSVFTLLRGRRLTIWRGEVEQHLYEGGEAGEVFAAGPEIVVSCSNGTSLRLLEVQLEGKRRMSANDFLNGKHVMVGERLG